MCMQPYVFFICNYCSVISEENNCSPNPCGPGQCIDLVGGYRCECPDDRSGMNCERGACLTTTSCSLVCRTYFGNFKFCTRNTTYMCCTVDCLQSVALNSIWLFWSTTRDPFVKQDSTTSSNQCFR